MAKVQQNSKDEIKFREKLTKLFVSKGTLTKASVAGGILKQNGTSAAPPPRQPQTQSNKPYSAAKQKQQTKPGPLPNGGVQQQQAQKKPMFTKIVSMKNKNKRNVPQLQQQQQKQVTPKLKAAAAGGGTAKLPNIAAKTAKPTAKPQPNESEAPQLNKNKAQQIKNQHKLKLNPMQLKDKTPIIQGPKSASLNGTEKTKIQTENVQQNKSKQVNLNSNNKTARKVQQNNKRTTGGAAVSVAAKKANNKRAAPPATTTIAKETAKQEPAAKKLKTQLATAANGHDSDSDLDSNTDSLELMQQVLPGYVPISGAGGDVYDSEDPDFTITDTSDDEDIDSFTVSTFDEDSDDDDDDDSVYSSITTLNDSHSVYDDDIHAPEHRIIHQGTAVKYEIPDDEKVLLSSDVEESHVVEFGRKVKGSVQQPKEFEISALMKLNEEHAKLAVSLKALTVADAAKKSTEETIESDCPELVPMTESDFDDSFEENYERLNSDDENSIISDINDKYLNPCNDYDSSSSADSMDEIMDSEFDDVDDDDEVKVEKYHEFRVDIVDGTKINKKTPEMLSLNDATSNSPADSNDDVKKPVEFECEIMNIAVGITAEDIANVNSTSSSQESFQSIIERPVVTLSWSADKVNQSTATDELDVAADTNDSNTSNANCTVDSPTAAMEDNENEPLEMMATDEPTLKVTKTRNHFFNAINCNDVLVLAKESIYIYGTVRATLLHGAVDIHGHQTGLKQTVEIYSPRGCSLVEITPQACSDIKPNDAHLLQTALAHYNDTFTHVNLRQLQQSYTPGQDAVLLLQRNTRAKKVVNNFKKFMTENVFPNINSLKTDRPYYASEYMLQCIVNSDCDKALKILPEWKRLTVCADTKMLLAGGKSVGKSTLLRYLVNRNLQQFPRILLIDLDIGQTELFVPQTVSCSVLTQPLLGPGFFLLQQPDKAYMVGHVNVALCAETYMRAVRALLEYCHAREEYAGIPWLVNTMGYNKGFGLELLSCVVDYLRPSDIVQLHSNKHINNFDILLERDALQRVPRIVYKAREFSISEAAQQTKCQLHVLHSAVLQESRYQKEWSMSPKDLRYAIILARLSMALQGNAEWLTDCTPLSAPLDRVKLINLLNESDSRNELLGAVETNLVYLCRFEEAQEQTATPLECYGIGVVRGIDHHLNQIYLLPATVRNRHQYINCLALGEMPLPNSLFANQGPKVQGIAPFVTSTVDANASKAVKQIYYRPTEFQSGVHREVLT